MTNKVQIKHSNTTATPPALDEGELAYSTTSSNLFIGGPSSTVIKIGGNSDVTKLSGIEAGAQVNTVNSVNGKTGNVVLTTGDINSNIVVDGAYVHTDNNYTTAEQSKLAGIEAGAQVNTVNSVAGKTGNVTLTSSDVGLGNVTNESKATMFTSPTFTGTVTLPETGSGNLEAATKKYVDSVATGLNIKDAVVAATTVAGTLATSFENGDSVGGVTVATGNRILIKDQADSKENGIYVVNVSGAPTRAADFDNTPGVEIKTGAMTYVESGTLAGTQWVMNTTGTITLGSSDIVFVQFGGGQTYTNGDGLTLVGTTFAVDSTVVRETAGVIEALSGANLTALNATNVSSGTLADGRLSANVLLNTSTIDCGTF